MRKKIKELKKLKDLKELKLRDLELLAPDVQERRQELANSATHAVAAVLAMLALGPLILLAVLKGNARHIVSFSLFGAALVFLYSASTVMHLYRSTGINRKAHGFLDHLGIYLVIAGTYSPFCLVTLHGPLGWTLFTVIWSLAFFGIVATLYWGESFTRYGNGVYLMMGWLIAVAIRPLAAGLHPGGLYLLVAGGLAYTVGVLVLALKPYYHYHAIWHLFVGLGSLLHLGAMIFYVLPDMR
jgi:hemolysin III